METNVAENNVVAPEVQSNPHAYVVVRHSANCKDRDKGSDWQRCRCRKSIFTYFPATSKTEKKSARTRSWSEAQDLATAFNDQFDPDKVRIKRLEADVEAKQGTTVRIEEAIGRFLAKKQLDLRDKDDPEKGKSTIANFQTVLGYVNPETFSVHRPGRLLNWINAQSPRPAFVSDLTSVMMESFRNSWTTPTGESLNQTSAKVIFGRIKQFFRYCTSKKWTPENPLHDHTYPKVKKGNRTGAFSDEQWVLIQMTAENNCTSTHNFDGSERKSDAEYQEARRLRAFVELLRWSGMAIGDAVQFRHDLIDKNGSLTYQRQKSKKTSRPGILPAHVLEYLHTVPVGEGTPEQPFLKPNFKRKASTDKWRRRLTQLYKAAGITKIKTEVDTWKSPKAHVLRDTFAIGLIRQNVPIDKVAAALGDTIRMVQDHYMPWIKEMETVQNEVTKEANAAQVEKLDAMREKMLAGGRNAHSR